MDPAKVSAEPESTSARRPDDLNKAELDKLRAETDKLRIESRYLARNYVLDIFKAIGVAGALLGILLTFYAQRQQLTETQKQHRDAAIAELAKRFGDHESAQSRLTAASALIPYLNDPEYADQTRRLLLSSIPLEREPAVRDFIAGTVVKHAGSAMFAALAEQNREFQERIAQLLQVPRWVVLRSVIRVDEATVDEKTPPLFQRAAADLEWNVSTMLRAISAIRHVRQVDLSEVTFISIKQVADPKDVKEGRSKFTYYVDDRRLPDKALLFENVNLSGANLSGLSFDGATFLNTRMDNVVMFRTHFWRCRFADGTTLRDFSPALFGVLHAGDTQFQAMLRQSYILAPFWYESSLDVKAFYPSTKTTLTGDPRTPRPIFYRSSWGGGDDVWFRFVDSTWTIHDPPPAEPEFRNSWRPSAPKRDTWELYVASPK